MRIRDLGDHLLEMTDGITYNPTYFVPFYERYAFLFHTFP